MARQLAVLLDAGIPLPQAVRSLSEQTNNENVRDILLMVVQDLENGYKFSEATAKHPKLFNHVFVSVVAAGESSGKLDVSLNLLANEMERDVNFRSRVIGALLYPAFIVVAMFVVALIMVTRIVPALESIFAESNAQLPFLTEVVVHVTDSIIHYWYAYIIGIAVIVFLFIRYSSSPNGRHSMNQLALRIPAVGTLLLDLEMARMTRILGIMIQSGVPIIQALNSVALVMDTVIYREALLVVAKNVERGAPISQTLSRFKEFPPAVTEMIAAGEKTGRLESVLAKLADFYEAQTDQMIRNITALIEPIVFVIVGLGVAFLVFSIIVPIYQLSNIIS